MTETNKSGFAQIGYLKNISTYVKDICKIAGQYIDFNELNDYIDKQIENKEKTFLCFNQSKEKVSSDSNDISIILIDTGFKKEGSGESIYGKFTRKEPGSLNEATNKDNNWLGVVIGVESELFEPDLNEYTQISTEDYNFISRALTDMNKKEVDFDCCSTLLKKSYIDAVRNDLLGEVTNEFDTSKSISFFPLNNKILNNKNGEKIFVKMLKNENPNKQKWYGAFLISEEDLKFELLSYFCYHIGYFRFKNSEEANTFFDKLAAMAMKENWNWRNTKSQGSNRNPILKSYLEFTYYHLLDEDEKAEDKKKKIITYNGKCYFNSGLLDKHFRQIIIVGDYSDMHKDIKGIGKCSWKLISNIKALDQNEAEIAGMFEENALPKIASYFNDYRQIVFDAKLRISLNDKHIFEDGLARGRLPKYKEKYHRFKDSIEEKEKLLSEISRDFDSALARTKLLAERNYKLAIPQYRKETGEIQFLLPIYLGEQEEYDIPQCALVISLDNTNRVAYYKGKTILTLDMAYNNARLIAKPDIFWLDDLF